MRGKSPLKIPGGEQNREFLFKSYLFVVGGLILIAAILDFSIGRLQSEEDTAEQALAAASLSLIESQLTATPRNDWPGVIDTLEREFGFAVTLVPIDHIVESTPPGAVPRQLYFADGRAAYLHDVVQLGVSIRIGPLPEPSSDNQWLVQLIPPIFYLSIFVFVSIWLWPVLRDLNVLSRSAQQFATDYREPMSTKDKTSRLRGLAGSFDNMSARIGGLIQGQKELTSALSHEMRTPLARIKFAMAVMKEKSESRKELESIGQDVQEIDQLIGTMLDYARLDHPDTQMHWQLTPIDPWLAQAADKCRADLSEIQIENRSEIEMTKMDPHLMGLALSNLLVNACRYANRTVALNFDRDDTQNRLSVDDDGAGIPEAERQAVFKAFKRLDTSRNRSTGGYGLGLAIVARIAALHGGDVNASQSELGGARISIRWPAAP